MVGSKIKKLRKRSGLTQEELGERLGRSKGTISRWEKYGDVPDTMLADLADVFGVEITALSGHLEVVEAGVAEVSIVNGPSSFARWFNELSKSGIDPELFTVMIVIGREASVPPWVASVSIGYLADTTPLTRPTLERLWPQVLESEWLERRGSGEWTFILKFPE